MPMSRENHLVANGFKLYTKMDVGLPHFVWRVHIDLEQDRNLHLSEETVLHLISLGVVSEQDIAKAMGLTGKNIIQQVIISLLQKNALEYDESKLLSLSVVGKAMLHKAKVRQIKSVEDLKIRHNPYEDRLVWHRREYDLNDKQMRLSERRRITCVKPAPPAQIEERYKEIQSLIERDGLPTDKSRYTGKREVLRVEAVKPTTIYRPAELEVWYNSSTKKFGWRILRDGIEETQAAQLLDQLEAEGSQIIPLEDISQDVEIPEYNQPLHDVAEEVQQQSSESSILTTSEMRDALKEAINDSQKSLIIISPWLRTAAINDEMTRWFESALNEKRHLKIIIGYGIEKLPSQPKIRKDYLQQDALRHLQRLQGKFQERLKLVEIGNTHEKIVLCDKKYAIITSFNFLSFNPEYGRNQGVRREIGYRITNEKDVEKLVEYVKENLRAS